MNFTALIGWIQTLPVSRFVLQHSWLWPVAEILHFMGLAVMFGTVMTFDLRVLGVARGLDFRALHTLLRWGLLAFVVNALTGAMFFLTLPAQYLYNAAFELKVLCLLLMGINISFFYAYAWRRLRVLGPTGEAPLAARISAALSMALLLCIACFGRFTAFYKFVPLGS